MRARAKGRTSVTIQILRDTLPAWGIDPADVQGNQLLGERVCQLSLVDGRGLILKRAWEQLDEARLAADARLLAHLHAHDVPVAVPLATQDGSCFVARGEHRYTLSPVLPVGGKLVAESVISRNVGCAIARLHSALAVYPYVIDSWTYDLPGRVLEECVSRCRAHLGRVYQDRFEAALSEFLPSAASMLSLGQVQRLHGDCHGGNVLIHNGTVSGFVDIDHLPLGPRLYDVGYYLADRAKNSFEQTEMPQGWLDTVVGVLAGYAEQSPWTREN